jgi:beta-glucosidase
MKELKGFEKVALEPGEKVTVTFEITEDQLRYHHADLSFKSDPGRFIAFVGPNSRDTVELPFELI